MSEANRIARLVDRFGGDERLIVASGDDAAVARARGGVTVTSIDAIVEDVDFTLPQWPLEAVGFKAVAVALSDLAAMGARPAEIYVAAGLPRSFDEPQFDALCEGIAAAAGQFGAVVAGGDLSSAGGLFLSVTVVGHAASADAVVTRRGARPGDLVAVTGELGAARRAVELIAGGADPDDPRLAKQFRPLPRLAAGATLAAGGATAMIDISDGLAHDAGQIAAASGVALEIELERIPLAAGIEDPEYAAGSGEEYELLVTAAPEDIAQLERSLAAAGTPLTAIGRVTAGAGVRSVDARGADVEVGGFDHFD
jgi:thiamine-monophosphate kinase